MHRKQSRAKEVADIIMDRNCFLFDLPLRERLLLVRHLLPRCRE